MSNHSANLTDISDLHFDILHHFKGTAYASFDMITLTNHRQVEGTIIEKQKPKPSNSKRRKAAPKRVKKGSRVRWSEVRKRCSAFFRLKSSSSFCAFYTLTFPSGLSDQNARKAMNNWLTRLRLIRPNMPYLWVAERQKNQTLHFHLITNNFLPVKIVNGFMATIVNGFRNDQPEVFQKWVKANYNGVDVRHVRNGKMLKGYLSKYMSKANESIEGSAWHCSRLFSRLATTICVHPVDAWAFITNLSRSVDFKPSFVRIFATEFATTLILPNQIPRAWIEPLLYHNNLLENQLSQSAKL